MHNSPCVEIERRGPAVSTYRSVLIFVVQKAPRARYGDSLSPLVSVPRDELPVRHQQLLRA